MNPLVPLFISLAETLIQDEPEIVAAVQTILAKKDPTPADWLALHTQVLAKSYADYVPASALPGPAQPAQPVVVSQATTESAPISQASASAAAVPESPYLSDGTKNPAFKE